jgi:DNA-directed RNA polymerase specialized sigma24 family protein
MQCHKCHWRRKIERGEFRDKPWEATPCSRCALFESSAWTFEYKDVIPAPDTNRDDEGEEEISMPISAMGDVLKGLFQLSEKTRLVVCMRYRGMLYREIGKALRISTCAAELRHRRAMRKWPALKALFPWKVAKHAKRCGPENKRLS